MSASTQLGILVGPVTAHNPLGGAREPCAREAELSFEEVYREHFPFVWRSVKRLGVRGGALDDVVQEVFVVAYRRLSTFEGRSSLRTWLFGIALRVVRDHRRVAVRNDGRAGTIDPDTLGSTGSDPAASLEKREAVDLLHVILDELSEERRAIFVLAELEQLPMPEIASALGVNLNTAYARLRPARQDFEQALARHRARDTWRLR